MSGAPVSVVITGHFYSATKGGQDGPAKAVTEATKAKMLCRAERVKNNIIQTAKDLYLAMDKDVNLTPDFKWITAKSADTYSGAPITTANITPVA